MQFDGYEEVPPHVAEMVLREGGERAGVLA